MEQLLEQLSEKKGNKLSWIIDNFSLKLRQPVLCVPISFDTDFSQREEGIRKENLRSLKYRLQPEKIEDFNKIEGCFTEKRDEYYALVKSASYAWKYFGCKSSKDSDVWIAVYGRRIEDLYMQYITSMKDLQTFLEGNNICVLKHNNLTVIEDDSESHSIQSDSSDES